MATGVTTAGGDTNPSRDGRIGAGRVAIVDAAPYFRAALRAVWPEVVRRVPTLRGGKARWTEEEIVVTGVKIGGDVNRLEEKAEAVFSTLGMEEVTVHIVDGDARL